MKLTTGIAVLLLVAASAAAQPGVLQQPPPEPANLAMIVAQTVIALLLLTGITMAAVAAVPGELVLQLRSLGAEVSKLAVAVNGLTETLPLFAAPPAGA